MMQEAHIYCRILCLGGIRPPTFQLSVSFLLVRDSLYLLAF